jgi:hypothetical protein
VFVRNILLLVIWQNCDVRTEECVNKMDPYPLGTESGFLTADMVKVKVKDEVVHVL